MKGQENGLDGVTEIDNEFLFCDRSRVKFPFLKKRNNFATRQLIPKKKAASHAVH